MIVLLILVSVFCGYRGEAYGVQAPADSSGLIAGSSVLATTAGSPEDISLAIYKGKSSVTVPFKVTNMFPGDVETNEYDIKVSFIDQVTVRYKAVVRKGYEKLAEALKVKVELLTTGDVLYDGLMKDMPESLNHTLKANGASEKILAYEISPYLETSVGNEYMNKELVADFYWWVEGEDEGNLEPNPDTGDDTNILKWVIAGAIAGIGIIVLALWGKGRKEKSDE